MSTVLDLKRRVVCKDAEPMAHRRRPDKKRRLDRGLFGERDRRARHAFVYLLLVGGRERTFRRAMPQPDQISLNAIRVLLAVAETESIKLAAKRFGVTTTVVTNHISGLEAAIGVTLVHRGSTGITMTDAGRTLVSTAQPGLRQAQDAITSAMGAQTQLIVSVPAVLATGWLIPNLATFQADNTDLRIRLETVSGHRFTDQIGADVVISYYPSEILSHSVEVLFEDHCRPYLAPSLLRSDGLHPALSDIPAMPTTEDNTDWDAWCRGAGMSINAVKFASDFCSEETARRGAIAGRGLVLAPAFLVADEVAAGYLVPLEGAPEVTLGAYTLHIPGSQERAQDRFATWLRSFKRS